MKFKIVTHYSDDDLEFVGDYVSKELFIEKDESWQLIRSYDDSYHESRDVWSFLDGVSWTIKDTIEVIEEYIADGIY